MSMVLGMMGLILFGMIEELGCRLGMWSLLRFVLGLEFI